MDRVRKKLTGLAAAEYEHPFDRSALAGLKVMPGLEHLVKTFNTYSLDRILRLQYLGSNVRISGDTFPEILDVVTEACAILDVVEPPALYIEAGIEIGASTVGVDRPVMVLTSACIDNLSLDELLFVIGRELGHVKSRHVLYHQIADALPVIQQAMGSIPFLGDAIFVALEAAILNWRRHSELTADRAGLLACQDINVANTVLSKIAGLPRKLYERFNLDDLVAQAREFKSQHATGLDKLIKFLSIVGESRPWTVMRAAELHEWEWAKEYERVLDAPRPAAAADALQRHCAKCGAQVSAGDSFCGHCGAPLTAGAVA